MSPRQISIIILFMIFPFFLISMKLDQLDQSNGLPVMLGPELYISIMLGPSQFLLVQKNYSIEQMNLSHLYFQAVGMTNWL